LSNLSDVALGAMIFARSLEQNSEQLFASEKECPALSIQSPIETALRKSSGNTEKGHKIFL
jgi:hypothetical protein